MLKKTILITGANGEIGQSLIKSFQNNADYTVIALDLSGNLYDLNVDLFLSGSITDKKNINTIFKNYKIDIVYHLAAILSTKAEKDKDLAYDVNVNGSKYLIDAARIQNNPVIFFFPSSIAVYNVINNKNQSIVEDDVNESPTTIYGQNKLEIEEYGRKSINANFDFRCIRFPGIISATTLPTGGTSDYAPEMIHHAAQKKEYQCFVNSLTKLPFIVMPDAIRSIRMLMESPKNNLKNYIYNISSFNPSVEDLYLETKKYFDNFVLSYFINDQRQKIVNSWPKSIDDSKAKKDWGWAPQYNLENAFQNYLIPHISSYYKGIKNEYVKK